MILIVAISVLINMGFLEIPEIGVLTQRGGLSGWRLPGDPDIPE